VVAGGGGRATRRAGRGGVGRGRRRRVDTLPWPSVPSAALPPSHHGPQRESHGLQATHRAPCRRPTARRGGARAPGGTRPRAPTTPPPAPQVGDAVPSVQLTAGTDTAIDLAELAGAGRTVVLFTVPGAFTPTCSGTHLPGFIKSAPDLKAAGADEVVCVAPNDAFVTAAWAASAGAEGAVTVLADPHNALAAAWGIVLDAEAKLGNKRVKRASFVLKDGKVAAAAVEPDGGGATCSLAAPTLAELKRVLAAA